MYPKMVQNDICYEDTKQEYYYTWTKPNNFIKRVCNQYNIPRKYFGDEFDYIKLIDLYEDYCKKHNIKYKKVKREYFQPKKQRPIPYHLREEVKNRYNYVKYDLIWNPFYSKSVEVA